MVCKEGTVPGDTSGGNQPGNGSGGSNGGNGSNGTPDNGGNNQSSNGRTYAVIAAVGIAGAAVASSLRGDDN
jgi:hypothetical protein